MMQGHMQKIQSKLSVLDEILQGKTFTINIHIEDDKGQKVADFDVFQEKLMHLVVIRKSAALAESTRQERQNAESFKRLPTA